MANTHSVDLEQDSANYFTANDSVSLSITGNMTIEAWIKLEDLSTRRPLFYKFQDTGTEKSYAFEIKADAPVASGTFTIHYQSIAANDYALTSGLTTTLNPWCEFSQDIFASTNIGNYAPYVRVEGGMSRSERAT